MDLKDTVELMLSNDYSKRLEAEYLQLSVRINKLENILNKTSKDKFNSNFNCSIELLSTQLKIMLEYKEILEKRLNKQ